MYLVYYLTLQRHLPEYIQESPMRRGAPRRMKIVLFSKESPMRRGAPRRMKIVLLFSRERMG
ncbi:hypothetical protein [Candidatus Hakubella thermalkaliphila]|uniref:hypothetical protein n=1 Tax=Candidatus Hakubella thermalkaliphila TaxID=2754717 RepID=UPI001593A85D|nr:hypothetical protein [Candidatus Hakubella thermalkaliphila]